MAQNLTQDPNVTGQSLHQHYQDKIPHQHRQDENEEIDGEVYERYEDEKDEDILDDKTDKIIEIVHLDNKTDESIEIVHLDNKNDKITCIEATTHFENEPSCLLLDQVECQQQSLLDQEQSSSLLLDQEQEQLSSLLLDQEQEEEGSLLLDQEQEEEESLSSLMMTIQQQSDCVRKLLHTNDITIDTNSIDPFDQKIKQLEEREAKIKQAELQIEAEKFTIDQEKIQIEADKSKIQQEKIQIEHGKFKNKKDRNDVRTAISRLRALVRHKVANHQAFWFMSAIHGANFLASMVLSDEDYYKMNYNHCFEYYRDNYNNYWGNNNLNSDNGVNFATFLTNSNIDFTNNTSNPLNIPDLVMNSSTVSNNNGLFDSFSNPLAESDPNTNLLASFTNVVESKPDLLASFTNIVENNLNLLDDTTNNNNKNNNKGTSDNGNSNNNSDDNNHVDNNNDKNIKDVNNNSTNMSYLQLNSTPLNSPVQSLLQSSAVLNPPIPPPSARPVISQSSMPSSILPSTKPIQPMSPMSWVMLMAQPSTAQPPQPSTAQPPQPLQPSTAQPPQPSQPSNVLPKPTTQQAQYKSLQNPLRLIAVTPQDNSTNKLKNNFVQNNQNGQNNQTKVQNSKLLDGKYQNLISICPTETCNTSTNLINLSGYQCPNNHHYTIEIDGDTGIPCYYADHQDYRLGQFLPQYKLPFKSSNVQDIYPIIPDSELEREDNCIFTSNGLELRFFSNQEPNSKQVVIFYCKNHSEYVGSNDTSDNEKTMYIVLTGVFADNLDNLDDVAYFKDQDIKIREKMAQDKQLEAKKNDGEQNGRTAQESSSTHNQKMQRINGEKPKSCLNPHHKEEIKIKEQDGQRIEHDAELGACVKKEKVKLKKLARERKELQLKEEEQQRLQLEKQQQEEKQQQLEIEARQRQQQQQQQQRLLKQQQQQQQQEKLKLRETSQKNHQLICEKDRSPTSNLLNNNNNTQPMTPADITSSITNAPTTTTPTRVKPQIRCVDPKAVVRSRVGEQRI